MVRAGALYAPGYEFESRRQYILSCSEMASHGVLAAGLEVRILSGQQGSQRTRLRQVSRE